MNKFEKDLRAFGKFKEQLLKPVPLDEELQGNDKAAESLFEPNEMRVEDKLECFSLSAAILSYDGLMLMALLQMAQEKGIDVQSELQKVNEAYRDIIAIGAGEHSLREVSESTRRLVWELRAKVANDEESFDLILRRTKQREHELLKERDMYLAGGE